MIIYLFNNFFPDNSGFGKRCQKEIEILSKDNDILVICRKRNTVEENKFFKTKYKQINVIRYNAKSLIIERTDGFYKSGFYEIKRNYDLLFNLSKTLSSVLWKNKKNRKIKLYTIVSPLTVPLIALIFAKLFRISPEVIEFHDLEPELAMHIKSLKKNSIVVKIEFLLEKMMCRSYKKIIVTNNSQANKIIKRTKIEKQKIWVIPNSIQINESKKNIKDLRQKYGFSKNDFIIGYVSNFSYDYTIEGMMKLLLLIVKQKEKLKTLKFILIGDGDGLLKIKKLVNDYNLDNYIVFTGRVENVPELISIFDVCLIPWVKDNLSQTILPTKLFEYMAAKKAIIAPNFGEFKNVLKYNNESLLFNNTDELLKYLLKLQKDTTLRYKLSKNVYSKYIKYYRPEIFIKNFNNLSIL